MDINEKEESFIVSLDLPGLKKEDFKVDVKEGVLTVNGERKAPEKCGSESCYNYIGRPYGVFSKSFRLPSQVDETNIKGNYSNGVLEIELPKKAEVKPREIEIK